MAEEASAKPGAAKPHRVPDPRAPQALLVDYGAGNVHSVQKALEAAGLRVRRSSEPSEAAEAEALVLPGQGHFGQVMRSFLESGFEPVVRRHIEEGRPFLGICVGLQLLMEASEEAPEVPGLAVLPGTVRRFPAGLRVPQMGWNTIHRQGDSPLLRGVEDGAYVYYANSYYADFEFEPSGVDLAHAPGADVHHASAPGDAISGAYTQYGQVRFLGAISYGSLHATQFHPEKSQNVGLRILGNFRDMVEASRRSE